jgi:hypothetical protein
MKLVRAPILVLKWLVVAIAALVWIVVVPIVDVLRDGVRWLRRSAPDRT